MADLRFNTATMQSSVESYRKIAEDMLALKKDLEGKIEELRNVSWQSAAGQAFVDEYKDGWAANVDKHTVVLAELASLIEKAAQDYERLAEKADALKVEAL